MQNGNMQIKDGVGGVQLSSLPSGASAILRGINGGCGIASRLVAMGFMPGMVVRVCRNDGNGPLVVRVMGSRIVLGRGMADKLVVQGAKVHSSGESGCKAKAG